jgi:pimeloyl-ACP methyl ester carboxylesterase
MAPGSSWNKAIPLLQAEDSQAVAVQMPLTSVADDLAATCRVVADVDGPIVLVGHSWGGMAVAQAGIDPKVAAVIEEAAAAVAARAAA